MNRFSKAPRNNFEFGGNLSYFSLCLSDNLATTDFLHYPPTFKWVSLTSNAFSEALRGQIKNVMNKGSYDLRLWFDMDLHGLALFLHAVVWWIGVYSLTYKLRPLKCRILLLSFFSRLVLNALTIYCNTQKQSSGSLL